MVSRQFDYGLVRLALASVLLATVASVVDARTGAPPLSHTVQLAPIEQVAVLELEAIDPEALLAEDEAAKFEGGAKPERFASPVDVDVTLADAGTWERLPNGGWVWRLRVHAPNATDLNFGLTRYRLAEGATLHIWSEDYDYVEGPYTAADASHAGDLWTPVVPGERAVLELYEPAGARAGLRAGPRPDRPRLPRSVPDRGHRGQGRVVQHRRRLSRGQSVARRDPQRRPDHDPVACTSAAAP